jgi:hypothetical protein
LTDHFASADMAKFYCENCDSYSYVSGWKAILSTGGQVRCDCSDFEEEE